MKRLVLYGGSFNPPTMAHPTVSGLLRRRFDRVVVLPCGMRPDKWQTNAVHPLHRANMARLAFRGPDVELDLSDLEREKFLTTAELDALWKSRVGADWEVWHAVGSDLIAGGDEGTSEIQRSWSDGARVWNELNFAVIPRPGYPVREGGLPPHRQVMPALRLDEASGDARDAFAAGRPFQSGTPPRVRDYAVRYGLYSGSLGGQTRGRLALPRNPRLLVVPNARNERAVSIAKDIGGIRVRRAEDADAVVAIGGDGHMLDVIKRAAGIAPVIGINAGHVGYLLTDLTADRFSRMVADDMPFEAHLFPMLDVTVTRPDGSVVRAHGFNDAWAERSGTQTAWVRLDVVGTTFSRAIERVACDVILVANPAGSTAYAAALGWRPIPPESHALVLAAGGVCAPKNWNGALLSEESVVTFTALDSRKRPIRALVDGKNLGPCASMVIRRSLVASAELGFLPGQSLIEKTAAQQFPA